MDLDEIFDPKKHVKKLNEALTSYNNSINNNEDKINIYFKIYNSVDMYNSKMGTRILTDIDHNNIMNASQNETKTFLNNIYNSENQL